MMTTGVDNGWQSAKQTIVDVFWEYREQTNTALTYLNGSIEDKECFSYGELIGRAAAVAALLQKGGLTDRSVLLLYPPDPQFIIAYLGALFAGSIAVPVYPPDPGRLAKTLPRLRKIIVDSECSTVLTTSSIAGLLPFMSEQLPDFATLNFLTTDDIAISAKNDYRKPDLGEDDPAFIQYTSGSTSEPKGVMIGHGHLLRQLQFIYGRTEVGPSDRCVSWLPPYHDMGLIGGILGSIFGGMQSGVVISPLHFLKHPFIWLSAISTFRGTFTVAPTFGYDLCTRKITDQELAKLDLSSLRIAMVGAEPVHLRVLDRFAERFAPVGFDPKVFYPTYGLAEATLMVSGGKRGSGIKVFMADTVAYRCGIAIPAHSDQDGLAVVSCGTALPGTSLIVVDPKTARILPDRQIGEIWFNGPSNAKGYWKQAELSTEVFRARTEESDREYLKTGDLGFLVGEEIYPTGRIKDLIVVMGKNHYPQDIEIAVDNAHEVIRRGCAAASLIPGDGEERLFVAVEIKRTYLEGIVDHHQRLVLSEPIFAAIRRIVALEEGIVPEVIALIKQGAIPKTTSGKIQRQATAKAFIDGTLEIESVWMKAQDLRPGSGEQKSVEEETSLKRPVGISSFGFGGTNAHLVVEEAPHRSIASEGKSDELNVLFISAKDDSALERQRIAYRNYLSGAETVSFDDVCRTAATRHRHFSKRMALIADGCNSAARLFAEDGGQLLRGNCREGNERPKTALLFSGQGSQYSTMGLDLYRTDLLFRQVIERCSSVFSSITSRTLEEILFGSGEPIDQTGNTQPSLYALECALFEVLRSWGIHPDYVMGHSVGAYAAAYAAGIFALEDGMRLVTRRGQLIQALPPGGAMIAILCEEARVSSHLGPYRDRVAIAAVNGPMETVISGDLTSVERIAARLSEEGVRSVRLKVSHPFHSPAMDPILDDFSSAAGEIDYAEPRCHFISDTEGRSLETGTIGGDYWTRHIRKPVRFMDGLRCIDKLGCEVMIEVGPTPVLIGMAGRVIDRKKVMMLSTLAREKGDRQQLLCLAGQLYVEGYPLTYEKLFREKPWTFVRLPPYPFSGERYWLSSGTDLTFTPEESARLHPLIHHNRSTVKEFACFSILHPQLAGIADHRICGHTVLPAAAMIEMARSAAEEIYRERAVELRDITWSVPLVVDRSVRTAVVLRDDERRHHFALFSLNDNGARTRHCSGLVVFASESKQGSDKPGHDLVSSRDTGQTTTSGVELYRTLKAVGLEYGPAFKTIEKLWLVDDTIHAQLRLARASDSDGFFLKPSLLDGAMQSLAGFFGDGIGQGMTAFVPASLDSLRFSAALPSECGVIGRRSEKPIQTGSGDNRFDLEIVDRDGSVLCTFSGLSLRPLTMTTLERVMNTTTENSERLFYLHRQWKTIGDAGQSGPELSRSWILCGADPDFLAMIADRLAVDPGKDRRIVRVLFCPNPALGRSDNLEIDPGDEDQLRRTIENFPVDTDQNPAVFVDFAGFAATRHGLGSTDQARRVFSFLLTLVKALKDHFSRNELCLILCFRDKNTMMLCHATCGFLRTLELEMPWFRTRCLDLTRSEVNREGMVVNVFELLTRPRTTSIEMGLLENRFMEMETIVDEEIGSDRENDPLVERGRYLISGGMGGLGRILALFLAKKYKARLLLCGRSSSSEQIQLFLSELENCGAEAIYQSVDVTDRGSVMKLPGVLIERFGGLDGVFHLAGTNDDSLIVNKRADQAAEVLDPKISGTLLLDEMTASFELSCFVIYSSLSALTGNFGQADYAFANAWLEGFVEYREILRNRNERKGKTVAIHWPLWQSEGMNADDSSVAFMKERAGLVPMPEMEGVKTLERILRSGEHSIGVGFGHPDLFRRFVEETLHSRLDKGREDTESADRESGATTSSLSRPAAEKAMSAYLIGILAEETGFTKSAFDPKASLDGYGIDSLIVMGLSRKMEDHFGPLPRTLLFEYQSIDELAGYFIANHPGKIANLFPECQVEADLPKKQGNESSTSLSSWSGRETHQEQWEVSPLSENDKVAIVGLHGRYPMADDPEKFFDNLVQGRDCVSEIPATRWDVGPFIRGLFKKSGRNYCRWGGFLEDVASFDHDYFKIGRDEANLIDPQERIFLEVAHQTLQNAGYTREQLSGRKVGVYVGVMWGQYQLFGAALAERGKVLSCISSFSAIANRVSYFHNFSGPSMAVDTMCSSSLTSIQLACEAIRNKSCEMALAGGVNLSLHPDKYTFLTQGRFTSSEGWCKTFGTAGDGYVPAEGAGAVLLKPLSAAIRDNDHIHGVILGGAMNHGGRTMGFSVPNPIAQAKLIVEAMDNAGVNPATIDYIEAHGTGTSIGDPIEMVGLSNAFHTWLPGKAVIPIGSVKSNIGHAESAAGIAGLTKVLLQFKHRTLVPSIHSCPLNPEIDFSSLPFVVQQECQPWTRKEGGENGKSRRPLRAGISAFGAGGSNTHLIVEEFIKDREEEPSDQEELLCFSAPDLKILDEYLRRFRSFFDPAKKTERNLLPRLSDIGYTLQIGREAWPFRIAFLVRSLPEFSTLLDEFFLGDERSKNNSLIFSERSNEEIEALKMMTSGEEGKDFIRLLLEKRELSKLGCLFLAGVQIDWKNLDRHQKNVRRVPLPVLPYKRTRCWFDQSIENRVFDDIHPKEQNDLPYRRSDEGSFDRYERQGTVGSDREERLFPLARPKEVFLTGATGLLGGCLIKELLIRTKSNLHCLVRGRSEPEARRRLDDIVGVYDPSGMLREDLDKRVKIYLGDITLPLLGLSGQTYRELSSLSDLVIHNAAKVSIHGLYESLKSVNIAGTANTIDFALATRQRYFAYVSSYAVMGDRLFHPGNPYREQDFDIGQGFSNMGYQRSKFEAEALVRASTRKGLRWIVYRPGNIFGESETGRYPFGKTVTGGAWYDLLKTMIELNACVPSPVYFDVTPVDYVASAIVYLSFEGKRLFETYHLVNPRPTRFDHIVDLLARCGYPLERLKQDDFIVRLTGEMPLRSTLTSELVRFNPAIIPPQIAGAHVDADFTRRILEDAGIVCPPVDERLFGTYLDYCHKVGYLAKKAESDRNRTDESEGSR